MKSFKQYLLEKKVNTWIGKVETEWHPKEGLFKETDPQKIANYLLKNSKDESQAMSRLVFYMNRAEPQAAHWRRY